MRIPCAFRLTSTGTIERPENKTEVAHMIFDYYLAGAGLGKVLEMLYAKRMPLPIGKGKWARAAVDRILYKLQSTLLSLAWNPT